MALIVNKEIKSFDTGEIKRGDVIRLKLRTETEAINGIVARVTPDAITVFYLPETANVTNYITLRANEAEDWSAIEWSSDLETIKRFTGGGADGTA